MEEIILEENYNENIKLLINEYLIYILAALT